MLSANSLEPDCGMAEVDASRYFKQLISGVVSRKLRYLYYN